MAGPATLQLVSNVAVSRCHGIPHKAVADKFSRRIVSSWSRTKVLSVGVGSKPTGVSCSASCTGGALPAALGVRGRKDGPCIMSSSSLNGRIPITNGRYRLYLCNEDKWILLSSVPKPDRSQFYGIGVEASLNSGSESVHSIAFEVLDTEGRAIGAQRRLSRNEQKGTVTTCMALSPATSSREEKVYDFDSPKMKELVAFLERDLVHLFDEQGIDRTMYDEKVQFKDPITKYNSLTGYLFNIQMLRTVLTPKFELHSVKQTAPNAITTRWTMTMYFLPLPWRPQLIFTGTSVMTVNEETGKFNSHLDYWDSIQNNEFFSTEAVGDLFRQLQIYKTPDLETPKYKVLKRSAVYQIRQYEQFLVAETPADNVTGNKGFQEVAGYLFGKNSTNEKMKMTTPVFNQTNSGSRQLQFVLPLQSKLDSVPIPTSELVNVRPVEKTYAAVIRFNGNADEQTVVSKEKILRDALIKDGLQEQVEEGFLLARYNDPRRTWGFMRRNEVIIWLKDFTLEAE